MNLHEAMRGAASIRRFRPDPVPDDVLYRVLDIARFAPSGGNRQGWRVIVVKDEATRRGLRDLYLRSWVEHHQPVFRRMGRGPGPSDAYAEHLDEVPVHLIVLVERAALITAIPPLDASRVVAGASIYPFVHNVALALRAEGLGTTLSTVLVPEEAAVADLLHIPAEFALAAHLGVGWPAEPHPTRLLRRPVEDFATLDRFDGEPLRAL
ncbi:MAG TPA: nitroreductase family protein [Terriglobales bacterium]|nr:nitroreductase family protein [Terriglobales bacterium]